MLRWGAPATEDFELEDEQPASQAVEEAPRLEAAEVAAVSEDQLAHISGPWTKCLWWICLIITKAVCSLMLAMGLSKY